MNYFTGNYNKQESIYEDRVLNQKFNNLYKAFELSREVEIQHYKENLNRSEQYHKEHIIIEETLNKRIELLQSYINLPWYKKMFISFEKYKRKNS